MDGIIKDTVLGGFTWACKLSAVKAESQESWNKLKLGSGGGSLVQSELGDPGGCQGTSLSLLVLPLSQLPERAVRISGFKLFLVTFLPLKICWQSQLWVSHLLLHPGAQGWQGRGGCSGPAFQGFGVGFPGSSMPIPWDTPWGTGCRGAPAHPSPQDTPRGRTTTASTSSYFNSDHLKYCNHGNRCR